MVETSGSPLLELPSEIRQQIFHHAVSTTRLAPFPLGDREWSMNTPEARGLPELLFVSKQLYEECIKLFYAQAILEIAPPQQGNNYFDVQFDGRFMTFAYCRLVNTYRFCRPDYIASIRTAHVFSNQLDVIDGGCYEATLQWLLDNTRVQDIQLSGRPMTRIRGQASFNIERWRRNLPSLQSTGVRLVRVWANRDRSPWETEKMRRLKCTPTEGTLKPVQIYFFSNNNERSTLQLDPRWFVTKDNSEEHITNLFAATSQIDALLNSILSGRELECYNKGVRYTRGGSWLYQLLVMPESERR